MVSVAGSDALRNNAQCESQDIWTCISEWVRYSRYYYVCRIIVPVPITYLSKIGNLNEKDKLIGTCSLCRLFTPARSTENRLCANTFVYLPIFDFHKFLKFYFKFW